MSLKFCKETRRFDIPEAEAAVAVSPDNRPKSPVANIILASLAMITVCYVARDLLIPITFALLMALLLRPLLRKMRAWRLPDLGSSFLLVSGVLLIVLVGIFTLAGQAQEWLAQAPESLRKVSNMIPASSGPLADIERLQTTVAELTKSDKRPDPVPVELHSQEAAFTMLGVSGHLVGSIIITFVLAFFFLGFSDTLLKQAVVSCGSFREKRNVVELVQNVENGVSRYLSTITVINIGLGIATSITMWLIGIRNPILWGAMVATINYIPHIGAFVCMGVLFVVGAVTHESLLFGAFCAAAFALLTTIESYFVTPMVLSRSLELSPLAVILAILFGGWLWGIAGGLMAAPLLAVLKIVCDQFESMHSLGMFLSGRASELARE